MSTASSPLAAAARFRGIGNGSHKRYGWIDGEVAMISAEYQFRSSGLPAGLHEEGYPLVQVLAQPRQSRAARGAFRRCLSRAAAAGGAVRDAVYLIVDALRGAYDR